MELAPELGGEHPHASYVLHVNGADRPVTDAWIGESLLYVLRERLGLAGAKDGCSQGECGACSVQVDGRLVASCLVPAATAAGSEVRTVEGLAADGEPSDVQRALAECGAVQCGFCVPGHGHDRARPAGGQPRPHASWRPARRSAATCAAAPATGACSTPSARSSPSARRAERPRPRRRRGEAAAPGPARAAPGARPAPVVVQPPRPHDGGMA